MVFEAESRLEARLYEAAALAELDAEMASQIEAEQTNLARVVQAEKAKRAQEERLRREAERKRREAIRVASSPPRAGSGRLGTGRSRARWRRLEDASAAPFSTRSQR